MIHAAGVWMRQFIDTTLPLAPQVFSRADRAPRTAAPPPRVLLVDDDEVNRMVARAQLLRWGIEPTVACDGAQAVELATSRAFDLVLMDVSMPVMDGLEATERIRRHERDHPERRRVPVVAYTAGTDTDDHAVRSRHGLDDLLRKPCSTQKVGECLQRWCAMSLTEPLQ